MFWIIEFIVQVFIIIPGTLFGNLGVFFGVMAFTGLTWLLFLWLCMVVMGSCAK